jgi:hypothetical protein
MRPPVPAMSAASKLGRTQMQSHPVQQPQEPQPLPERAAVPVTAHGRLKVTYWVIGTLPSLKAAHRCADTLAAAGFTDVELLVESAATTVQQLQADEDAEHEEGFLARIFDTLKGSLSGRDATLRAGYLAEARVGRSLVGAHDVSGIQYDRIRNTLIEHGARYIHLFEPTEVRRLD